MTKYHDKHQNLPKYFTDGSERAGKVKWGYLVKQDGKLITSQSGEITVTAQLAEVLAVEKALQKAIELGHKEIILTSDSEYVVYGVQKELETWRVNGFHTACGKPMAHKEQWEKIDKLPLEVKAHFYHQVSHTKQTGEAADRNREVDKLIGRVKLQEITELFQKMNDELNHPSVNMVQMELRLRNLNIPNWRTRYREVRKDCKVCRKCMTSKGCKDSESPKAYRSQQISIDFAGTIRPMTKQRNCYFLPAIDNHSKEIMIWPMKSALEENVVKCLSERIKWRGKM